MGAPLKPENVRYLVVHCSATPAKMQVDRALIDRWHRDRGWLGIGYHFVIRRDAAVEVGRPISDVGAHVEDHNAESVGICMAGGLAPDAKTPENNFTADQLDALYQLLTLLLQSFPKAQIVGHRDLSKDLNGDGVITPNEWFKACPSFDVPAWWAKRANGL